jgi:hypothetical protein
MPTGRTIAAAVGRCARCRGPIEPGSEYVRSEDDAGSFVSGAHVTCGARPSPAAAPSTPRRLCVCGGPIFVNGRTGLKTCWSCRREFGPFGR